MVHAMPRAALAKRLSWLAAPALLFVICCGFCWRLVLSREYTWLGSPDLIDLEVPRLQFQASQWRQGAFPLWDPHQWCGQPFLGQVVGAANPVNWPLFLAPSKSARIPISALHWYFVAIHFLGALFAYALCRDLQRSRAASVAGAIVFALSGFFGRNTWPEVMGGILWIPLVFLFLLRVLRGRQATLSAALCGLFLGVSWLSGHHEIPIYLSWIVAVIWLYHIMADPGSRMRLLKLGALALLIAILTSGLQTVPGYEYARLAQRWVGTDHPVTWREPIPYSVDAMYSFHPGYLPSLLVPSLATNIDAYLGLVAVSLALFAVLSQWKERWVRLFAAVAILALLFAMGKYNLFHGILYALLPLFGKARTPGRLLCFTDFAAAPLVAYGLDGLLARSAAWAARRIALALAVAGGAVYAVTLAVSTLRLFEPNENVAVAGLVALLLAGLLLAWQKRTVGARLVTTALVALMLVEYGMVTGVFTDRADPERGKYLPKLTAYDDIAAFLRKQPDLVRINFDDTFNFGDWQGIDSLRGFGASVTLNLFQLDWPAPRTQDLLGVTYTVARAPARPGQVLVFQGASGFNVYRNPNAFPRVWTVHQTKPALNADAVRTAMSDPAFDARTTAPMVESAPALETCGTPDDARMSERAANTMTIQARMGCRGLLVIADTWYPGWEATVDGHPAPILQPYFALRGVVVDAGAHNIAMRYRPRSVLLGALMTAAGILGTALLALFTSRFSSA